MDFYSLFLIVLLYKKTKALYSFQCPVQAHWKLRSEMICESVDRYFCLYDQNKNKFPEFCREHHDFEGPGQKLTVAGSINGTLQGADCDNEFYQPFQFLSSGNSRCVYKKSYCSGEGQTILNTGTRLKDRSCRCDYSRGYDFIVRPKHRCYCIPTEEDCSCYLKLCSLNDILSPDYECLDRNEWKTSFKCDPISVFPEHTEIPSNATHRFKPYLAVNYKIGEYTKRALVAVISLISTVIVIYLTLFFLQDCLFRIKRKCTDLDTVPLDEVEEKRVSLKAYQKRTFEKQLDATDLKIKDEIIKPEENKGKVSHHVQELQEETIQNWRNKLSNTFVVTKAAESVYQRIKSEKIVAIIGPTGTGKSAYAYYSAFKLKEENDYAIVPVRKPSDFTQYDLPGAKQVFVIDDFIGKYALDEAEAVLWEKEGPLLKKILSNNEQIKVILTCRKSIWLPEKCEHFGFSAFVCDLHTDELRLKLSETRTICKAYIKERGDEKLNDNIITMYNFLPSLCSIFSPKNVDGIKCFFTMPVQFIENEMDNYKSISQVRYMSLAVLAINQKITKKGCLNDKENEELIKYLFDESGFQILPSKKLIISHIEALRDTYVKVDNEFFEFIHHTMQNIVLYCIAKTFPISVLKYCKSDVFINQVRLTCIREEQTVPVIKVIPEQEEAYFTRLTAELGKGRYSEVFGNNQNTFTIFREKFLVHLNKIRKKIHWKTNSDGLCTVLHVVSSLGYEDYVSYFIKIDNRHLNKTDAKGNTPLHLASLAGHLNVVKCLVEKGCSVQVLNNEQLSPFLYACEKNEISVVNYLISLTYDAVMINEKYMVREYKSVLHIACMNGFEKLTKILLDHNASINIQDKNGLTPLHLTCLSGQAASASLLIKARADVNALDILHRTPVYYACTGNYKNIVKLLIEYKADINQDTTTGSTPLHLACEKESLEIVNILIQNHSNVNVKEITGRTPLHIACKLGNERLVNFLIDHNASVNSKTKDNITPLHEACYNGHSIVADILLKKNANYKQRNKKGQTALLISCAKGYNDIVNLILSLEVDVNSSDNDGVTPLMLACSGEYSNVIETLLVLGANVKQCDNNKRSPLEYACVVGNVDIVNSLFEYSANINLANKNGITPLHTACKNNHKQVVNALIEKKADINLVDVLGETPLYQSCIKGNIEIVKILLKNGAAINITDNSGTSPATIAKRNGFRNIVKLLDKANTHM